MLNLFKRNGHTATVQEPLNGHAFGTEPKLPEVEERVFTEPVPATSAPSAGHFTEKDPQPVPVDHNINLLYAFLDRNHEAKGYDDALLNPDSSHLQQNLEALKNELARTIKKVKTFYEDFIQETDYHIQSRSRSGMIDMVDELEMKKRIALGHVAKVKDIQESLEQENGDCKGLLISYTRGFKNGLAAISHHHILTKKF